MALSKRKLGHRHDLTVPTKRKGLSIAQAGRQIAQAKSLPVGTASNPGASPVPYDMGDMTSYGSGGTIHIKKANRGKFNATKAKTGKSTEALTHSSNPLTKKRAIFAQNARKWHHHPDGGWIQEFADGGLAAARKRPGGSNVGKKTFANGQKRTGPYAGPGGGAPAGSYPIPDIGHARAALRLAHHAPNPAGIRAKVIAKYPQLKATGGFVSSDKAKEILRDGTAQGHKLTPAQKRYFGWRAGGSHATGGFSGRGLDYNGLADPFHNTYADGGQLLNQIEQERIPNPGGGLNKQLIKQGDGVNVFSVNGNFVRHHFNPDFVVGGHHYVGPKYKMIPKNEIWIDDAYANDQGDPSEKAAMDAAMVHELNERIEMKDQGKSYNSAHNDSNKLEQKFEGKEGYAQGGRVLNPYTAGVGMGNVYKGIEQFPPEYDLGGIMKSLAPFAGMIPGMGPVASAGLNMGGSMLEGVAKQKTQEDEEARQRQLLEQSVQQGTSGNENPTFKYGGIHIKKSHEGKFTAWKKRTGKTTAEALHSKSASVRKMANFARNAAKWHHAEGGWLEPEEYSWGGMNSWQSPDKDSPSGLTLGGLPGYGRVSEPERMPSKGYDWRINNPGRAGEYRNWSQDTAANVHKHTYADGGPTDGLPTNYFKTNKTAFVDSTLNANKDIEWVKRLYNSKGSMQIPGYSYPSTHLMSDDSQGYVFPRIIDRGKGLEYMDSEDKAQNYARNTDTGIQFTPEQGKWFANNGYKQGTGVLRNTEYPFGGNTDPITSMGQPVELEKQEVWQTPQGDMGQVNGPSHAQGGVDVNLPNDSFIWSDRLKAHTGRTFADEAAYLGRMRSKYAKILNVK